MLNNMIATLLTVGGSGFVNFAVASQLNAVEPVGDKKTSQVAYSIIWSIIDFAFFLFLKQKIKLTGNYLLIVCMLLTLAFAFVISLLLSKPLQKLSYFLYGLVFKTFREGDGLTPGTTWNNFWSGSGTIEAYCYDLAHNPIGQGFVTHYSKTPGEYDLILQPFKKDEHKEQWSYDQIEEISQKPENWDNLTIRQYVSFKENIIIFTIEK